MLFDHTGLLLDQGREFPAQWQLQALIADNRETLFVEQCLRLLPGRRVAVRAQWRGRGVFLKVFFGRKARAEYQYERDMIERLSAAAVQVPTLLATGTVAGGGYVLVSEFLPDAVDIQQHWQCLSDDTAKEPLFKALVSMQLALYRSGLYQADAHLGNYVISEGNLFALDAGGVKPARFRRRALFLSNLALLLAQFNWREFPKLTGWTQESLAASNSVLADCRLGELQERLLYRWRRRLRKVSDKSLRACSKVLERKTSGLHLLCRRRYASAKLLQSIECTERLDQLLAQGSLLKQGNSATVAKVELDGRAVVIKRYNLKSRWIAVKRALQTSRARRSWYNAHLLELMGFDTPEPIALIEEKIGGFTQRAYLITAWTRGQDFGDAISADGQSSDYVELFSELFKGLRLARVSHGDMKATNFIIEQQALTLIDLDSMRFHRCSHIFHKRLKKDVGRFLANWKNTVPEPFRQAVEPDSPMGV